MELYQYKIYSESGLQKEAYSKTTQGALKSIRRNAQKGDHVEIWFVLFGADKSPQEGELVDFWRVT